jgi:hypothetical protein
LTTLKNLQELNKEDRVYEMRRNNINHDMRSPINTVISFSDLMLQTETHY